MPLLQTPRVQQTGQFLVGRSRSCDLRVNHPTVSKAHALIGFPPGWPSREHPWHLHDCTSTNGTYVAAPSGLQAAPAQGPGVVLQPGLSIILGAIEILFLDSGGLQDLLEQWRLGSTAATRRPPRPGP